MSKKKVADSKCLHLVALTALSVAISSQAIADDADIFKQAITDSSTKVDLRYRFEGVDQEGSDKNAYANTLRSRLTWTSGTIGNFLAKLEFDDSRAIGEEKYNSTSNGKGQYPVVADPEGTEVNQAYLQYKKGSYTFTGGRQRINFDDQRFVGGVGWRQNEQTYDGARFQYNNKQFSLDYSFVSNVNRIFGPEGEKANLDGDIHLLNASTSLAKNHKLTGFAYSLDFEDSAAYGLSSSTYGLRYNGDFNGYKLAASYARQSDTGDNPVDYSANYALIDVSGKFTKTLNWNLGYEILGSDEGIKAFATPLATLHKFQGFADKFLATPNNGINDAYVSVGGKVGATALKLTYHDFQSDEGGEDLGTEWDATAFYPISKNLKALVKYAHYSADDHASDTQKLWFQLQLSL